MYKRFSAVAVAVILFGGIASTSWATVITFNLTVDPVAKTWNVTANNPGVDNKGLAGFNIDVLGAGGISVIKQAVAAQTNWSPNPPFTDVTASGTIQGTNVMAISGFQPTVNALNNQDDSHLVYFEGIVGGGAQVPLQLARGRFTGASGSITVQAEQAGGLPSITLFPLNYDVNGDGNGGALPGTTGATSQATAAPNVTVNIVPEPASLVLMGFAGLGLVVAARRRRA